MAEEIRKAVLDAVRYAQRRIQWRPGKAETHLLKRIKLGHLGPSTTLDEYETVIRQVLHDPQARIYVFIYQQKRYPSLVSDRSGQHWLVMLDMQGGMETAFVVEQPETYFSDPRFTFLGRYQELMR
jgi:succinyl-CoA synthetase beta subunit